MISKCELSYQIILKQQLLPIAVVTFLSCFFAILSKFSNEENDFKKPAKTKNFLFLKSC
jgi:hypothetical protein